MHKLHLRIFFVIFLANVLIQGQTLENPPPPVAVPPIEMNDMMVLLKNLALLTDKVKDGEKDNNPKKRDHGAIFEPL